MVSTDEDNYKEAIEAAFKVFAPRGISAYKYVSVLWRKKSEPIRFLQWLMDREYREQPSIVRIVRATRPETANHGFLVYRVRVRFARRVTKLKFRCGKRSAAEELAGRKLGGFRVVNPYFPKDDSTDKYNRIIMLDPVDDAARKDPRIKSNPVHIHRELRRHTSRRNNYPRNFTRSLLAGISELSTVIGISIILG